MGRKVKRQLLEKFKVHFINNMESEKHMCPHSKEFILKPWAEQ
jgi:hypothetical protein